MNVCIVKEDRVVMIDGEGMNFDFDLPTNVWAVQWNGSTGEIEFTDGTPNEAITDFSAYQSLVDGHATEKQRLADEMAQKDADNIANYTYSHKRSLAYPSLAEQADMLWHSIDEGVFGVAAKESPFYLANKKVKDDNPKNL